MDVHNMMLFESENDNGFVILTFLIPRMLISVCDLYFRFIESHKSFLTGL